MVLSRSQISELITTFQELNPWGTKDEFLEFMGSEVYARSKPLSGLRRPTPTTPGRSPTRTQSAKRLRGTCTKPGGADVAVLRRKPLSIWNFISSRSPLQPNTNFHKHRPTITRPLEVDMHANPEGRGAKSVLNKFTSTKGLEECQPKKKETAPA